MQIICAFTTLVSVAMLLYSIVKHCRSLNYTRRVLGETHPTAHVCYRLSIALMAFFAAGYLAICVRFLMIPEPNGYDLLAAAVFFFGAVFVTVMVTEQSQMNRALSGKTEEIIASLVGAIEAKDLYTRGHSLHVSYITELFYQKLPATIKAQINQRDLISAAVLHDIGKIGIADSVLNKPGRLTDEEYEIIKQHAKLGARIVADTSFSRLGRMILCHHERYDGNGYYRVPYKDIPLESQIIAIADTFSALTSTRIYRPAQSFDEAMAVIRSEIGTHFEPLLGTIFCEQMTEQEMAAIDEGLFEQNQPNIVEALLKSS